MIELDGLSLEEEFKLIGLMILSFEDFSLFLVFSHYFFFISSRISSTLPYFRYGVHLSKFESSWHLLIILMNLLNYFTSGVTGILWTKECSFSMSYPSSSSISLNNSHFCRIMLLGSIKPGRSF